MGWENKTEKYWLDWFEGRSYTLLFVDGNHKNFDRLNGYPGSYLGDFIYK